MLVNRKNIEGKKKEHLALVNTKKKKEGRNLSFPKHSKRERRRRFSVR